jgi:peptidoglycan hydrolase-like protein with peptidoglycan-binding domain
MAALGGRTFRSFLVTLLIALAAVAPTSSAAADAAAPRQNVYAFFTKGEQLAPVARSVERGDALEGALRALLAGPRPPEAAGGVRTAIPAGTTLHRASVEAGVATVDVSAAFAAGSPSSQHTRLVQLVFTATQFPAVRAVRVLVDGAPVETLGGALLDTPLGRDDLGPAPTGGPTPAVRLPAPSPLVRAIQARLIALSYLPAGAADGIAGPQTRQAILAFQGWRRIERDGRATRALHALLRRAATPRPRAGVGHRIELHLDRQVALLVEGRRVVRTVHVSTGASSSPTPRGSFRVYRKELRSWSYPYSVWLPYASYFTGGIAFHESNDVPAYPASHGCARVPASDARTVWAFATMGTRVTVI